MAASFDAAIFLRPCDW